MFQKKLQQIIEQPKQALLWVTLLSVLPLFHWFALLLMLVVTLRNGARAGLLLAVVAAILGGVVFEFVTHYPLSQVLLQITYPLLLWLAACLLRVTASWQYVLLAFTALGVLVVIAAYSLYPEGVSAWSQALAGSLQQVIKNPPEFMGSGVSAADWQQAVQVVGQFATGLRVLLTLALGLVSLLMARYIQAALYNPGGLKQALYYWRLDFFPGLIVLGLLAIAALIKTPLWLSMIPVLMLPFICTGFSLVHYFTAASKYQWLILLLFYVSLITVLQQLLLLVVFAGSLDVLINFRKRFALKR